MTRLKFNRDALGKDPLGVVLVDLSHWPSKGSKVVDLLGRYLGVIPRIELALDINLILCWRALIEFWRRLFDSHTLCSLRARRGAVFDRQCRCFSSKAQAP